jgi:hypothetical protein
MTPVKSTETASHGLVHSPKRTWLTSVDVSGIEVMHMIRKGQMKTEDGTHPTAAEQFYSMVM